MTAARRVVVFGVPFDLGAGTPGCAGGPAAIRRTELAAGLRALGLSVDDEGDVPVPPAPKGDGASKSAPRPGGPAGGRAGLAAGRMRHAEESIAVCRALAARVYETLKAGAVPVVLGGDHSISAGSISGAARALKERKRPLGVIWVDAHGDMNSPKTSPSGNLHGMPLAHLVGLGDRRLGSLAGFTPAVEAARVCLVGIRDLDSGEKANLRESGVHVFTMADVDRRGMADVAERAVSIAGGHTAEIHLSFDIDAADPSIAEGTGTKKRGGLTYREAHLLMEVLAESGRLASLDMVEVNPLEDVHNATAELASELIQSALGKRIY